MPRRKINCEYDIYHWWFKDLTPISTPKILFQNFNIRQKSYCEHISGLIYYTWGWILTRKWFRISSWTHWACSSSKHNKSLQESTGINQWRRRRGEMGEWVYTQVKSPNIFYAPYRYLCSHNEILRQSYGYSVTLTEKLILSGNYGDSTETSIILRDTFNVCGDFCATSLFSNYF